MTPRRLTAALALVAVVLLGWGAFSRRWLVADVTSYEVNGRILVGLTGLSVCATSIEASRCESVEWKDVNMRHDAGGWMWLGRLVFGLSIAAAVALLVLGIFAAADLHVQLPLDLGRWTSRLTLSILPLMFGYYMFSPTILNAAEMGRGFPLVGVGAILGAIAAYREAGDRFSDG